MARVGPQRHRKKKNCVKYRRLYMGPIKLIRYSDSLRAMVEFRWGARSSIPVQTGPGAHPASYTMGTGCFVGVKRAGAWH